MQTSLCSEICLPQYWPLILFLFLLPIQIWVRKTSDSTKMRIYLGQLQRGLFVIRRRSAAWCSPVFFFPRPLFWNGFWFCFLNRKFLTWEWLLGLGRWRTLWWILQGILVASPIPPCIILSLRRLLPVVRHPETVVLSGALGVGFTNFLFFAYALSFFFFLSFKATSDLKGQFSLLSICLPWRGAGRGTLCNAFSTIWIQSVDHVGPFLVKRSSLLPQKLGAEVLAEGESFSGLSLLGETNVLCYVCVCHPFHCLKDRNIHVGDNVHCSKRGQGRESVSYS